MVYYFYLEIRIFLEEDKKFFDNFWIFLKDENIINFSIELLEIQFLC